MAINIIIVILPCKPSFIINQKHKTMKKIFSVLAAAVIAFAFTSCGGDANTPEKVAEKFVQHVAKGEIDEAKKLATEDVQGTLDLMKGGEKSGKEVKIEDMKCDTKENDSKCTFKKDGVADEVELKKVDGNWKISKFNKEGGLDMDMDDMGEDVEVEGEEVEGETDDVTEENK